MDLADDRTVWTIYIEGSSLNDIASFYQQLNEQLMQDEDWKLGESLDAFDDLLYGGYGAWKDYDVLEIIWTDIARSESVLGIAMTKKYYEAKRQAGSTFNQDFISKKLQELEEGTGQTYFEMLMDIIESHSDNVHLVKR